jgi:hypothetical protein
MDLTVTTGTVAKWESGKKHPSGPALKLLDLIEGKGLEAKAKVQNFPAPAPLAKRSHKTPRHLHDCQSEGTKLPGTCTIAEAKSQNSPAPARLPKRRHKTSRHLHD